MGDFRILDSATEELFESILQEVRGKFAFERIEPEFGIKLLSQFD